jgi:hypothetical protein
VWTLNNYTDDDVQRISGLVESDPSVKFLIFGREIAPTTQTPHLQGFVIFSTNKRFAAVKRLISDRAYVATANATSEQCRAYCRKERDFEEFGEFPDKQGQRNDLAEVLEWSDDYTKEHGFPPSARMFAVYFPQQYVKYSRMLIEVSQLRAPPATLRDGDPRPWQSELEAKLLLPANDRKIMFFVDTEGGTGKSWFQGYFLTKYPEQCQLLGVGKRDDIAYAIEAEKRVFLFNVPRGAMQFLQYTIFEQLKDKVIFSTKYHTKTKILRHFPHVVIFSNEHPDESTMTADRYDIVDMGTMDTSPTAPTAVADI